MPALLVIRQKVVSSKWSCADTAVPAVQRRDSDDGATQKKPRVVWSAEMHQQFVEAVERLGVDSAHFKVPGLCFCCQPALYQHSQHALLEKACILLLQSELRYTCACSLL